MWGVDTGYKKIENRNSGHTPCPFGEGNEQPSECRILGWFDKLTETKKKGGKVKKGGQKNRGQSYWLYPCGSPDSQARQCENRRMN